jgi:hypothetical protein
MTSQALRVLKLLEEQHRRLASIVKSRDSPKQETSPSETTSAVDVPAAKDDAVVASKTVEKTKSTTKSRASSSALSSTNTNNKPRDSSPSLARDIASRRGIPQPARGPPSAAAQARAREFSPESRRSSAPRPKVPPSVVDSQAAIRASAKISKAEDDEGFAKFYNNITTGTMSKLSSVLAYAGLPLTADDAVNNDQQNTLKKEKQTVRATNDPDVNKIFSKAALAAIEDEHRQRGTLGHGFGPAESFYVVQKGGGTYSYADIARAQQREAEEDDEEPAFVDAKEVPSPKQSRSSRRKRDSFGMPRTQEELELENTTLKTTLEHLASRLEAFEAHAQDASMAALTQSMISVKPPTKPVGDEAHSQSRLRELELQVEQQASEEQKLRKLSDRQARELKKYQHQFEKIKSGARQKERMRQEQGTGGDGVTGD